jgi:dihydropyrimidine dehydrogenase (NAD+) subunit PreT
MGLFTDLLEPLDLKQAKIEASRCYYCFDAPCIDACPTGIDIPSFIRKIGNDNIKGAALDILSANIMGGTCARACPVETLCQSACVREKAEKKPVLIGQLQRYATDVFFDQLGGLERHPFARAPSQGKKIAVVGAGPAGLSCAHQLAILGYEVDVFEARSKAGGLNEYGLAPYKMTHDFAQKEVEFILSVGGIHLQTGKVFGSDVSLENLKTTYSAVFLGLGLGSVGQLGIPGESLAGVLDAARTIEAIRQTEDFSNFPVSRHVVVIGGGNTAVDIAIQMKKLGAEFVTLAYRRGRQEMGATHHEQDLAQLNGVLIQTWVKPVRIFGDKTGCSEIEFEYTKLDQKHQLQGIGQFLKLPATQIFRAIGQNLNEGQVKAGGGSLQIVKGKIKTGPDFETTVPGVFAGGDCVDLGEDLTVTSVQQGKLAAQSIDRMLRVKKNG